VTSDVAALLDGSLVELAAAVTSGEVSAGEVTRACLSRIDLVDDDIGAFLSLASDGALAQAATIDDRRARGEALGPLAGVPVALKDCLCTRDLPTTAGSRILTRDGKSAASGYRPPYDATAVARLRAAGAVVVGKCNMDELAMGSSNENSAFHPVHNPWDPARAPGGSSGGSAAAVASGMAPAALGSDTGGSVRQPAAFTGTVGIKPSYGRVSRYGLVAFASSLDQIGTFARDVRGAALLLEAIAGRDPRDATSLAAPVGSYLEACGRSVASLRIGVPAEYFAEGLADEVRAQVEAAIERLGACGATVVPIQLPHTRYAVATYYLVATAECSSNLARFDGVRYGLRVADPGDGIGAMYDKTRGRGFGAEVKRRIMLGTYALSAGYYQAYYGRAQRARTLIAGDFARAFEEVDVIATPVSPTVAFALGERVDDPLAMYLADIYTLPASLAGLAAISLPVGLGRDSGMPVGLQLIAPALSEERMLSAAAAVEAEAPDREVRPLLWWRARHE
jgi:aspartyl-tRNA(Asn)/glutamyl-tRNA(Gln) amidotransferase subunit A